MYLRGSGCSHPLYSLLSPSHPCQPSTPFMSFCLVFRPLIQTKVFCRTIGWELAIIADGLPVGYTIKHNGCPSSGTHQYPVVHLGGEDLHKPLPHPYCLEQAQCRQLQLWHCVSNGCVMPRRQHFTDFLPIFWFLCSFQSLFHHVPWSLEGW